MYVYMYITFDVSLWKDNRPRIRYIVDFPGSTLTTLVQTCMMYICMYVCTFLCTKYKSVCMLTPHEHHVVFKQGSRVVTPTSHGTHSAACKRTIKKIHAYIHLSSNPQYVYV